MEDIRGEYDLGGDQFIVQNITSELKTITVGGHEVTLEPGQERGLNRDMMTPEELGLMQEKHGIKVLRDWMHIDLDDEEEEEGLMLGEKEMYYPELGSYSVLEKLAENLKKPEEE